MHTHSDDNNIIVFFILFKVNGEIMADNRLQQNRLTE
jgi:hypothetical protein